MGRGGIVWWRSVSLACFAAFAAVSLPSVGSAVGAASATFKSTGAEQHYVVPNGVRLVAVGVQGAWGGAWAGGPHAYTSAIGQSGAAWQGLVAVKPGEKLYVEVGSNGAVNGRAAFGGGGAAGSPDPEDSEASSGGGATDIRTCSELARRCLGGGASSASRLLVAGGAGGNGGSAVTAAAGLQCGPSVGGQAVNEQPVPKGNPALGPVPIVTRAGIVIPGFAGGGDQSVKTRTGTTDAGAGSTVAGRGGSATSCGGGGAYQGDTFSGGVPGSPGAGPNGGAGANAAGLKPQPCNSPGKCNDAGPGGGGGGGYFGGGGGASGFDVCSGPGSPSCGVTSSLGGGAGSSFVAKGVLYPTPATLGALGSGVPFVRIAPVVEIDAPVSGAVYRRGEVVHAKWSCSQPPGWGYGVQNCTATSASGAAISTTPGSHTFTVHGINQTSSEPVTIRVTYSVR